jgi:hypothetical protein
MCVFTTQLTNQVLLKTGPPLPLQEGHFVLSVQWPKTPSLTSVMMTNTLNAMHAIVTFVFAQAAHIPLIGSASVKTDTRATRVSTVQQDAYPRLHA